MEKQSRRDLKKFNYLNSEIGALYHEAAVRMEVSDSVLDILYTVCEFGEGCTQKTVSDLFGTSKQTIHSASKKLQKEGLIFLQPGKGRDMGIFLTEQGKALVREKVQPIVEMENEVFEQLTDEERRALLELTEKYRDILGGKIKRLG